MWGKVTVFVLGATVGWIIGSRSGRESYERVAGQASRLWRSGPVQRTAHAAQEAVRDIPKVGDAAADGLGAAGERVNAAAAKRSDDAE